MMKAGSGPDTGRAAGEAVDMAIARSREMLVTEIGAAGVRHDATIERAESDAKFECLLHELDVRLQEFRISVVRALLLSAVLNWAAQTATMLAVIRFLGP